MYYVYEWFIVDTGEIIYVGKGKGKRYKVRSQRNKFLTDMLKRCDCDSRIVKEFETEKEAFEYEFDYIRELKAKGECVCNIYNGGAGGSGEFWTEELRKKYSEKNVMKSEHQRQRMSEKNPMKNPTICKKVISQKKRSVIIGDKIFESVKIAHEILKVATGTIIRWCKKGINRQGEKCRYADGEQIIFSDIRYNKGNCKGVIYKGVHYESQVDLAKAIDVGTRTISEWLKRGFDTKGNPCRYETDDRELAFVDRHVKRNKERARRIIVNDIAYISCDEASKVLGIPKSTLYSYLQGKKHNPKYICRYDNQQPSRVNTDKSNSEGSTTNG